MDDSGIGIRLLDRDHDQISTFLNELHLEVAENRELSRTVGLLREMAQFTRSHFALEEGMMGATHYPRMMVHRLCHQWTMEQFELLLKRCKQKDYTLDSNTLDLLSAAHLIHLQNDDLKYGLWLNWRGVKQPI
jgi:hemerythrin